MAPQLRRRARFPVTRATRCLFLPDRHRRGPLNGHGLVVSSSSQRVVGRRSASPRGFAIACDSIDRSGGAPSLRCAGACREGAPADREPRQGRARHRPGVPGPEGRSQRVRVERADEYAECARSGERIRVILRRRGRHPVIAVDDDGLGMSPDRLREVARNLFESSKAGDAPHARREGDRDPRVSTARRPMRRRVARRGFGRDVGASPGTGLGDRNIWNGSAAARGARPVPRCMSPTSNRMCCAS